MDICQLLEIGLIFFLLNLKIKNKIIEFQILSKIVVSVFILTNVIIVLKKFISNFKINKNILFLLLVFV